MLADWVGRGTEVLAAASPATASETDSALDFQVYKPTVEPIFWKERPGHARCYSCHTVSNKNFHLETLSSGSTNWTDEQSQRNFQNVVQQVFPGDPASSRLLIHPLAPEAGGDPFHSGGRQFASRRDPDWLGMAAWGAGHPPGTVSDRS